MLNRLTAAAVGNGVDPGANCAGGTVTTVAYDAIGNITAKSDVGTYSYSATQVHAVSSIAGIVNGVSNPTFTYDSNGNMTAGDGRSVTYTAFNMAASITEGTNVVSLSYDSEHSRVKQCLGASCGSITYYLNDAASGAMSEKVVVGSTTTWRDYLKADGKIIAERFAVVGGATSFSYFVLDHLGSVAVVTDASGNVTERDSYDPWGRRRNIDGSTNPTCSIVSATTRGFTNQEEMDSVCLVNLNARIYDPTIGKFLSADPVIGDPYVGQEWNHYAYVINNPLSLTDPTGLCFLGCFWKSPIFRDVIALAVAILLEQPWALPALLGTGPLAIVATGGIIGGITGAISTGTLKGVGLGVLQGALFAEAGNILGPASGNSVGLTAAHTLEVFVAHGLVGGIVSTVGGGKFGAGFLSGAVSSLGPQPVDGQDFEATAIGTAESAVLVVGLRHIIPFVVIARSLRKQGSGRPNFPLQECKLGHPDALFRAPGDDEISGLFCLNRTTRWRRLRPRRREVRERSDHGRVRVFVQRVCPHPAHAARAAPRSPRLGTAAAPRNLRRRRGLGGLALRRCGRSRQ